MISISINDHLDNLQHYRVNIIDHKENSNRYKVQSFKFERDDGFTDLPKKQMQKGKVPILKCRCGSNSFSENGRHIGEYECPCCSEFIELYLVAGE